MARPTGKPKKTKPKIPIFRLPGKGNIDPGLIRKAVIKVISEREKETSAGISKARTAANGKASSAEAE